MDDHVIRLHNCAFEDDGITNHHCTAAKAFTHAPKTSRLSDELVQDGGLGLHLPTAVSMHE
jgi:hypothetical protein